MKDQARVSKRKNREKVGQTFRVLFEGPSAETDLLWQGRTETQAPVIDGAEAVSFLVRIKELVEDPESLLLEG